MSDALTPPATPLANAPEAVALLEPAAVLAAVSDPSRYAILAVLATGASLSVNDLAAKIGRPPDAVSKHLRVLRDARLLRFAPSPGADGRMQFYEVPALFRTSDAAGKPLLDFGAIILRFG